MRASRASGARRREDESPQGRDAAIRRAAWFTTADPPGRARPRLIFGEPRSRDAKDTVYCSIQMPISQGRELLELIARLRALGEHPSLEPVFQEAQGELEMSIEFVERMLAGEGALGQTPL